MKRSVTKKVLDAVLSLTVSEAGVEEVTEDAVATVSYFSQFLGLNLFYF